MTRPSLAILCLAALLPAPAGADEMLADGIAAQVGTEIVLYSEVVEVVAPTERQMRAAGAPKSEIAKLRAEGLETMIEWRLIEKVVREAELFATDEEVDRTIELIAQENGLSVGQLKKSLTSQGMSFDEYRGEIKRELERRKVVNALVASRVHVEEEEVQTLYKERYADQPEGGTTVHLRQMLVPAGEEAGRSVDESCTLVEELRARVAAGEPFDELAYRNSAAAPQRGGDIGWLHQDSMAGWMLDLIEPLEAGQSSDVVRMPFGCTFIELVERREYEPISYEKAKPQLQNEVFDQKVAQEYRTWMEELRAHTFIERRGYFADAAQFGRPGSGSRETSTGETGTP
jgi:peptidyl-prolyl cis-trans isomerase SurA